jgi:hypothetical protein
VRETAALAPRGRCVVTETAEHIHEAFDVAVGTILEPEELAESLLASYSEEAVDRALAAQRRLLMPDRRRPRRSPASVAAFPAALRHGSFYYTFGLRDELLTGWTEADKRWQTGFIQHHGVVRAAGLYDGHVEIHDQLHAILGLHWYSSISWHAFYVASRLSEATASYHYFFLDEMFEPRCEQHEGLVDVTRILRMHACDACQREENLWFHLSSPRRDRRLRAALEYARQARLFFVHELRDAEQEIRGGLGFVARNPVNHVGNVTDSLRYAYYVFPVLASRGIEPYVDSLREWQVTSSLAEYVRRAAGVTRIVSARGVEPDGWQARLPWRRRLLVAQDVLLRIGIVLGQHELGQREIDTATADALAAVAERAAAVARACGPASDGGACAEADTRDVDAALRSLFEELCALPTRTGEPELGRMIATVGYELELPLADADPATRRAPDGEPTRVTAALEQLLPTIYPRTFELVRLLGRGHELAERFRRSPFRWTRPVRSEADGRMPEFDELLQRFLLWLQHAAATNPEDEWLDALAAAAAVEYEFIRYRVETAPDLDVATPIGESFAAAGPLRRPRRTRVVRSSYDRSRLKEAATAGEAPVTTPCGYAMTIRNGRPRLLRVDPLVVALVEELESGADVQALLVERGLSGDDGARLLHTLRDLQILEGAVPAVAATGVEHAHAC